ncbi:UNVERIFIED_CONTAM: hypothetical protein PYX00_008010 [Menopon gallinae]|uniref:dolichol kinase n=1 Tax=Menopon gallinae TaxID=328185 RepID=A0AAW2HM00_9NEOP
MDSFHSVLQLSAKRERIVLRQKASNGVWVSFLLPLAILISHWKFNTRSEFYTFSAIYSLNLLLNVFHLLYHIYRNESFYVTKKINILCAIPSSVTIFYYVNSLQLDFRQALCYTVANALIYFEGLPFTLKVFPNSFTFGEANLFIQGLSLFLFSTFTRLSRVILNTVPHDDYNVSTTVLQIGHIGMIILCIVPFIFHNMRNPLSMYMWIGIVIFGFMTFTLNYLLGSNPILWLWSFFMKTERFSILLLWFACFAISGMLFWHRIKVKQRADTVLRKYFHVLAGIVFVVGVIFDSTLIYFASGCVFALFILLEVLRVMKIPPLYEFLQNSYKLYADEKDSGIVALTPIYLLVGYSLPIWIHPLKSYSSEYYLQLLSGVLCIGVGDTCASVVGKAFGKHCWKGTKKTVEGTIASVFGQIIFVLALASLCDVSYSSTECSKILLAVIIPSLVEALTDQIDNIVLPLITYSILMI